MRKRYEKRRFVDIDKSDRLSELRGEKLDELLVACVLAQRFELRLVSEMRQNRTGVFHHVVIASLCCIVLAGCGHKTDPVYIPDDAKQSKAGR